MFRVMLCFFLSVAAVHAVPPNSIYINAHDFGVMDVGFNSARTPHI